MPKTTTTKKQRDNLLQCHIGVGFLAYHSAPNVTTEVWFCISRKDGKLLYIANGKEVQFDLTEEDDG